MDLIQSFKKARQVGTPLIGIETPDPAGLISKIGQSLGNYQDVAIFRWDSSRGLVGMTPPARKALDDLLGDGETPNQAGELIPAGATANPVFTLKKAVDLPTRSIIFMVNIHRWLEDPVVVQSVWNLRDLYKPNGKTMVLLAPLFKLPPELEQDVLILDDPLPDDEEYKRIIQEQFDTVRNMSDNSELEDPSPEDTQRMVEALRGLAAFPAEEAAANAMSKTGMDVDKLWVRKCRIVEQTQGLEIRTTGATYEDIGGLGNFKRFMTNLFPPNAHPDTPITAVIFLDEIEKALGGSTGPHADSNGISQDYLGVLLREMEDNEWTGLLSVGPAGSGKSIAAKATGNTFRVPTLRMDLGAMKGGIVGESEGNIRSAMKVIKSIGGKGCFFIATCNRLEIIPPELKRRFTMGVWFFDLPTEEEREGIWKINLAKYDLEPYQDRPDDDFWTGAEIRNCCDLAKRQRLAVAEAGLDIRPVAKQDMQSIERLRALAAGKWNSASYRGYYQTPDKGKDEIASTGRRMDL